MECIVVNAPSAVRSPALNAFLHNTKNTNVVSYKEKRTASEPTTVYMYISIYLNRSPHITSHIKLSIAVRSHPHHSASIASDLIRHQTVINNRAYYLHIHHQSPIQI